MFYYGIPSCNGLQKYYIIIGIRKIAIAIKIMETITKFMADDHDRLDSLFASLRSINAINKVKEIFHEFKIGLQRHIVWEEKILFPIFEAKTNMQDSGPTAVMRSEHRKIKELLEKMHQGIIHQNIPADAIKNEFVNTLGEHNSKEEAILYPWIDDAVDAEEIASIFARMKSLPSEDYNQCCE